IVRPGGSLGPLRSIADVPARSRQLFGIDVTYPALATVAACASGAVLLAKPGSAINHVIELDIAASLVCGAVLAAGWDSPRAPRLFAAASLLLVPMLLFEGALLVNDSGRLATVLQLKSWGTRLRLTTREAADDRERIAAVVATLPHPIFTDDELFAQPW